MNNRIIPVVYFLFLLLCQNLFSFELIPSSEVRNHVLRVLSLVDISKKDIARRYTQEDGKQFIIKSMPKLNRISIIPEIFGFFEDRTRSSWELQFDSISNIKSISAYLQSEEDSFLLFQPDNQISNLSVTIRGKKILSEIKIPIAIKNVFGMNMAELIRVTRKSVPWDWFIPSSDNFENYSAKENIAGFLQQNFKVRDFDEIDFFSPKNKETQWYAYALIDFVNTLLSFTENEKLVFLQFFPLQENRKKLSLSDPSFLYRYITNVVNYLSKKSDFLASSISIPSDVFTSPTLENLELRLYMLTVRYPSYFFIVPIDQVYSSGSSSNRTTVALRIYIPYFTPNGKYTYYQTDFTFAEDLVIDTSSNNYSYYFDILSLNLPFAHDLRYE